MVAKPINNFFKSIIPQEHRWKMLLLKNWDYIIGEFKGRVIIERIQGDLLVLGVSHPVFAQELFSDSDDLIKRINKFLKEEKIKKIQFRYLNFEQILKRKNSLENKKRTAPEKNKTFEFIDLTMSELEMLNKINDKSLKESLRKFYLRCKRY